MKLALNTTPLLSPLTGIGQYIWHLAQALQAIPEVNADYFYGVAWQHELKAYASAQAGKAFSLARQYLPFSYEIRRFVQTQRFKSHARKQGFDVYHEPNYLTMPFEGPTVLTVHDLSWIRYPETHPVERVKAMNKHIEASLASAQCILTDSVFIRQEVIDKFGIAPNRIQAIPLGVSTEFQPKTAQQSQTVLQRYALNHGQYFLAVGTLEPRKNLSIVFDAYQQLPPAIRQRYPLVLAGLKGWHTQAIEQAFMPLLHSGELRLLGYVPREDLTMLTAGALTLVYPSIYEGFGLPPLEALACGVPPIVSNVSSLPEVVTQGGIKIDPQDSVALANAMQQLVDDSAFRQLLSQEAYERAQQLTWQQCANKTFASYQQAIRQY